MFAKQCLRTKVKHAHALNSLYVAADGRPHGTADYNDKQFKN